MARTQTILFKGKQIYLMDFSNIKNSQEISTIINEATKHIRNQPLASVFTLTNLEGMHFNNEIRELFHDFIKGNKPFVKAGAVIGLSSLQQLIYNGLMKMTGRDIKSFSDIDNAKTWLFGHN
jgi:hypothetical protein